jgi:polyferredoxin
MRTPTGRFFCGKLCPLGIVQRLLHKIPFPLKAQTFPGDRQLRYLKYGVLALWVGANVLGFAASTRNNESSSGVASLSLIGALAGAVALCAVINRPLCRYLCPAGLALGWANQIPLGKMRIDHTSCTSCGLCSKVCPMGITPYKTPNSVECIRCDKCIKACPHHALAVELNKSFKAL